jgi:hypothetical protein
MFFSKGERQRLTIIKNYNRNIIVNLFKCETYRNVSGLLEIGWSRNEAFDYQTEYRPTKKQGKKEQNGKQVFRYLVYKSI